MKELVFALEFKGSAAPVPGSDKKLRAKTLASSQTLRSILKADGFRRVLNRRAEGLQALSQRLKSLVKGCLSSLGTSGTETPVRCRSGQSDAASLA